MLDHPKRKGDRTTLAVMLALVDGGIDVSVPFGENTRYDLIVDRDGDLSRVQCKTGRLRDGRSASQPPAATVIIRPRESRGGTIGAKSTSSPCTALRRDACISSL